MAGFLWEGKTRDGDYAQGYVEAADKEAAIKKLAAKGVKAEKLKKRGKGLNIPFFNQVDHKTLVVFTRQLATMIDAGLPLVQCLEILSQQEPDPAFQSVLLNVKATVESGTTFAESLAKHPTAFDSLFINLVAAGEMGGILDTILNRLAVYMEKSMKLKAKVKGAMKYPITILIVSLGITIGLLWKVVPTFAAMFKSMGKDELPALTEVMVALSDNLILYLPGLAVFGVVSFVGYQLFVRTEKGRRLVDTFMLKLPLFGDLIRKAAVAKFTRTMGTLISSGVPILDALDIVAKTAGNKVVEDGILYTKKKISEGKSIAGPLLESGVFPKMVVQMIAVGESTGAMDIMLVKIADFYDDEVEDAVDGVTALIEPIVMVVLGGIIGFVMIAMYLPIFTMADTVGGAGG